MAVDVHAQVVLQRLGEIAPRHLVEVLEEALADPDERGEAGQEVDLGHDVGDAEAAQPRALAPDHDIDRDADQDLGQDVEQLVEDGVDDGETDAAAIRVRVPPQANDRMHWPDC
jgi:hypothetical protein